MKALRVKLMTQSFALVLFAGAALTFSMTSGAAPVWAFSEQSGKLHVMKECSQYTGASGSFCTITASNVGPIKVNSKVYYDQAAGIPAGLLDSNVVLDAEGGEIVQVELIVLRVGRNQINAQQDRGGFPLGRHADRGLLSSSRLGPSGCQGR